jgi:hypothetical protein
MTLTESLFEKIISFFEKCIEECEKPTFQDFLKYLKNDTSRN